MCQNVWLWLQQGQQIQPCYVDSTLWFCKSCRKVWPSSHHIASHCLEHWNGLQTSGIWWWALVHLQIHLFLPDVWPREIMLSLHLDAWLHEVALRTGHSEFLTCVLKLGMHPRLQFPRQSCLHEDQCTLSLGFKVLHDGLLGHGWVFINILKNSHPIMQGEVFMCFLLEMYRWLWSILFGLFLMYTWFIWCRLLMCECVRHLTDSDGSMGAQKSRECVECFLFVSPRWPVDISKEKIMEIDGIICKFPQNILCDHV